jgi:Zn-dependent protease with chaperone function
VSQWLIGGERTSPVAIACVLTMLMTILLPFLMLKLWQTERLGKTPKDRVAIATWIAAGGDPRSVRRWKTNASIAGAMVLGWSRRNRYLLLSDVMLEKLDMDEIRMVVLHEAAHGHRWHIWLRMIPVWTMAIPILAVHHLPWSQQIMRFFPLPSTFFIPSVVVLSLVSMCLFLSWIARWTEFDADKFSVELSVLQQGGQLPNQKPAEDDLSQRSTFSRQMAARALIQALRKLTPESQVNQETWLHPSLDRRVKSLKQRYFYDPSLLVESIDDVGCLSSPL